MSSKAGKRDGEKGRVQSEEHGPVETAQPAARQMYESLTRTRSGPDVSPWQGGKDPRQRVGGSAGKPVPASQRAKLLYPYTREGSPPGGQTRSSLAGGSQPIVLPCRSKAAATDQEAGPHRPRAPPQERQHPMLSRRLLLGLSSWLLENGCILVQSTSKAGGQVRPAGAGDRACPVVGA